MKKFFFVLSFLVFFVSSVSAQFPKRSWIRTAAITYGLTDSIAGGFLGRVGVDLILNGSNTAYGSRSGVYDNVKIGNPDVRCLVYLTTASYREAADYQDLLAFCAATGRTYVADSFFLKVTTGSITLTDVQAIDLPCVTGHQVTTNAGSFIEFCGWTTANRREWDYAQQCVRDFQVWRGTKFLKGDYTAADGTNYDGVIEDENCTYKAAAYNEPPGNAMNFPHGSSIWVTGTAGVAQTGSLGRSWVGKTYAQVLDSLTKLKQNDWLKRIGDTSTKYQGTGLWFCNSVTYGAPGSDKVPGDLITTNTGIWPMENALNCITGGYNTWNNETWKSLDTITKYNKGYAIVWTTITRGDTISFVAAGGNPTGTPRAQMQRLCYYYMAHHPERTYFMLSGNAPEHTPNDFKKDDTLFKWVKPIGYNLGVPTGARFIAQQGTDNAGQSFTIYRRNFTNGIVLYRPDNGTNFGSSSAVTYSLGVQATPVYPDSTTGVLTGSASIRNCEGLLFLTQGVNVDTALSAIDPVDVNEGQIVSVQFELDKPKSQNLTFNWATQPGTAQPGVNYTHTSGQVTINSGSVVSAPVQIQTIRDNIATTNLEFFVAISGEPSHTNIVIKRTASCTVINIDPPSQPGVLERFLRFIR